MYGFSALKCTACTSSSIFAVVSEIVWRSKPVMGGSLGVSGEGGRVARWHSERGISRLTGGSSSTARHGRNTQPGSYLKQMSDADKGGPVRYARGPLFYPIRAVPTTLRTRDVHPSGAAATVAAAAAF